MSEVLTVALIGNPNTGKSTLFNALSGSRALTGNYPGVTVEKKVSRTRFGTQAVDLVDLPGTYSLAPRSLDEMVSVNVLLGRQNEVAQPDVIVCIVDASNLERNLFLVSQVLDLGRPVVLVLNMADVARERGIQIDAQALSARLGVAVVNTQAHRSQGIDDVRTAVLQAAANPTIRPPTPFPDPFLQECGALSAELTRLGRNNTPPWLVSRLLLDVGGWLETHPDLSRRDELAEWLRKSRERLASLGCRVPAVEARARYGWISQVLQGVMERPAGRVQTFSDRLDRLLTHHVVGLAVFALLMLLVFQAIYRGATPLMEQCELAQQWLGDQVGGVLAPGPLRSLIVDGIIGGVGAVLVFLPQIVILFLFIALLEDCGYMARAAFLMDKLMTRVGLSGRSFVPLMSSFACAVPGIMATRVIENRRDRLTTILVAPLMSCSARQPVYALLIGAFIPATYYASGWIGLRELVLFGMTSLGALVAIPVAWLLKKTLFRGETPPFVMELPTYKWPSPRLVINRVYDRAKAFVVRAGTLIFATNVLVWAAGYYPGDHSEIDRLQVVIDQERSESAAPLSRREELSVQDSALSARMAELTLREEQDERPELERLRTECREELERLNVELAPLDARVKEFNQMRGGLLEQSLLGRLGHALEPIVKPLGWDWRIGVGVVASFPAREVIIGTLGTIYSLGGEDEPGLANALQGARWPDGRRVFSVPVALSVMVFFALCAQCSSTLMVIQRETNDWRWAGFTFLYMTVLAYGAAFATTHLARWFCG